jgi:hypothetical protein
VDAFVGADRDRPLDGFEGLVGIGGEGLLDEPDACVRTGGEVLLEVFGAPALVCVDDQGLL